MSAIVAPDEEECYLLSILDSADGLDLAEFAWHDPESDTDCYRAWDFQWSWYTCDDTYQVDQGGRALGKTVSIAMRAFAFVFAYPGQKMLITAPELNHLRPLVDAIEQRLQNTRLLNEMRPDGKGGGISRQPQWQVRFKNGTQIISRLPNKDGKGVKGQHVILIELDEAQDYPLPGWIEIVETLNRFLPGAMWRCHGVPKGVRDKFYEKTEDPQWKVHRPMAMFRPSWGPDERREKINEYGGSRQNIDYKRNIYGEHGDASNSVFVLARLMACVDTDEGSLYNNDVYYHVKLLYEQVKNMDLLQLIDPPGTHKVGYSQKVGGKEDGAPNGYSAYYGGMDVGVTNHPSEILIYGQRKGTDVLDLLTRIHMQRIPAEDQIRVVEWCFEYYGTALKSFGLDKTGVGQPLWDILHRRPGFGNRVYGYGFSEKVCVGFEDRELEKGETVEDLAIERNVVEASTDWLRNDYIDVRKMRLPFDKEVLLEFQGQTYMVVKDNGNPYGTKRIFGGGSFHTLDAAKMMVAGRQLPALDEILNAKKKHESILDVFVGSIPQLTPVGNVLVL
jgi:hypothetical protein